jgi:hypothetical protein
MIITCPKTLEKQKNLLAVMVHVSNLNPEDRSMFDGLLDWLQVICDLSQTNDHVGLRFEVEE